LINEFKVVRDKNQESQIEKFTMDDAKQFPLYAGGTLVGLYGLIKYFGKEIVNPLILAYMGVGGSTGIKGALLSLSNGTLEPLDERVIVHVKIAMLGVDFQVTVLDVISLMLSFVAVGIYVFTKNWIYNNLLAIIFCVHAIQFIFLGNFKNGFLLLVFLFFYDIFFVFGTDVMLTVAKNIDAPIKLLFPRNLSASPPEFSLLGLGDIVIPGIFIALCLRYDVLRTIDANKLKELVKNGHSEEIVKIMQKQAATAPRPYFQGAIVGYLIAIVTTVVVMFIFDHGQPALLYLVPGVLFSVLINAWRFGELTKIFEHSEEELTAKLTEEKPEAKPEKKEKD